MRYVRHQVSDFQTGRLLVFLSLYFCLEQRMAKVLAATSYQEQSGIVGGWKQPEFLKIV